MQTILVTGSNGLLGQKLITLFKEHPDWRLVATSHGPDRYPDNSGYLYEEMDVRNQSRVREVLRALKPDAIVHTAAMTNVDACENDREGRSEEHTSELQSLMRISYSVFCLNK